MQPAPAAEHTAAAQRSSGRAATALVADAVLPWRNPAFIRFFRSRLRLRKATFWYLLTLIITTFVVSLTYTLRTNALVAPETAARSLWIPLLVIQGLILMIKGTGSVAAGLIQDKIDQTLDYQRLTPLSPLRSLVGYLFGLASLEYAMFALTLPHLAFVVVVGNIPIGTLLSVYCSFFVCVILYHMTGIAAGMIMRRWIFGYMLSILLVLVVNVILPSLVSQLGLRFFQYLSVWPVIGQKVLPVVSESPAAGGGGFLSIFSDVPFYAWSLSPFVFTLLLQGMLILTFGVIAVRRWKSATRHSLSKPYALAFLTGFVIVLIGNVWPIVTRQSMPFSLFGATSLDQIGPEVVGMGLPLVYAFVVWILCLMLLTSIVPSHHSYLRGLRRALKHGRPRAPLWDDDSAALPIYAIFTAVAVAGLCVLLGQAAASGFFDTFENLPASAWRLPLALALVVFYSALLLQALGGRKTALVVLILWFVPILISIVLSARWSDFEAPQAIIASLSPIAFVAMSGMLGLEGPAPDDVLETVALAANTGLVFIIAQTAYLWIRWHRHVRAYDALCRARGPSPAGETSSADPTPPASVAA